MSTERKSNKSINIDQKSLRPRFQQGNPCLIVLFLHIGIAKMICRKYFSAEFSVDVSIIPSKNNSGGIMVLRNLTEFRGNLRNSEIQLLLYTYIRVHKPNQF